MMECDVFPEFYNHSEPVAVKQHRCVECRAPIRKGEKHFYCVGKWEGFISHHRQHLECLEACMLIRDAFNDGNCIGLGDLKEAFGEIKQENPREWYGESRYAEAWKRLRHLMAVILWRERKSHDD